jgi:hypothetical protein
MPHENDPKKRADAAGEGPRTDLTPEKIPYDDDGDYFGQGEEEGVVKERQATAEEEERQPTQPELERDSHQQP